jgi:hypothetical protein
MFQIFRNNRSEIVGNIPVFSTNKSIVYSPSIPSSTDVYWYETDAQGNQIHAFPWLWDSTYNGWKSPLKEYFYAYRQDYDAAIPIGGKRHLIKNADWWFFPVNPSNIPNVIWLQDGQLAQAFIYTTSINGLNGGRSENLNVEINANNNLSTILECRYGTTTSYNNQSYSVWGNIKLEYNIFR